MFTPPPSPMPPQAQLTRTSSIGDEIRPGGDQVSRRKANRPLKFTLLLVPLGLILIAASTRYITHPAAFDLVTPDSSQQRDIWSSLHSSWKPHKRHPYQELDLDSPDTASAPPPQPNDPSSIPPTPTAMGPTTPTNTPVPAIPINPVLPTPFPQPFDTSLSANFSTQECYTFFQNMTNVASFRSCRPFSLLLVGSLEFIRAQNNITMLNDNVWGTCNTNISQVQCDHTMAAFASQLESVCQLDLGDRNAMAVDTLIALKAYDLMRDASCQTNPTSNAYCYVEAIANFDASASYFYQLPLGQMLPNITDSACTPCTQSLLSIYTSALTSTNASHLIGLERTYAAAAQTAVSVCGSGYAVIAATAPSSTSASVGITKARALWAVLVAISIALSIPL